MILYSMKIILINYNKLKFSYTNLKWNETSCKYNNFPKQTSYLWSSRIHSYYSILPTTLFHGSVLCINVRKLTVRPIVAQRQKRMTVNVTGCGIDSHSRKLIEFRHSTFFLILSNFSGPWWKMRSGVIWAICGIQREGKIEIDCSNFHFKHFYFVTVLLYNIAIQHNFIISVSAQ